MVDSLQYTPQITLEFPIGDKDFFMAGEYASRVKKTLQQLGLDQNIIRRVAIIIYEAAMNVAIHAHHGTLTVHIDTKGIFIRTDDEGVGIADIELAMQEGYSTASDEIREMGFGAGMGLFNIKQCSDELSIDSKVGVGTVLSATVYFAEKGHTN
jgi:anti-sigma regulatory factor (Ser/Thr protein kinase)